MEVWLQILQKESEKWLSLFFCCLLFFNFYLFVQSGVDPGWPGCGERKEEGMTRPLTAITLTWVAGARFRLLPVLWGRTFRKEAILLELSTTCEQYLDASRYVIETEEAWNPANRKGVGWLIHREQAGRELGFLHKDDKFHFRDEHWILMFRETRFPTALRHLEHGGGRLFFIAWAFKWDWADFSSSQDFFLLYFN